MSSSSSMSDSSEGWYSIGLKKGWMPWMGGGVLVTRGSGSSGRWPMRPRLGVVSYNGGVYTFGSFGSQRRWVRDILGLGSEDLGDVNGLLKGDVELGPLSEPLGEAFWLSQVGEPRN